MWEKSIDRSCVDVELLCCHPNRENVNKPFTAHVIRQQGSCLSLT